MVRIAFALLVSAAIAHPPYPWKEEAPASDVSPMDHPLHPEGQYYVAQPKQSAATGPASDASLMHHPVHPEGQYYVSEEPVYAAAKGKISTKWPTAEEKRLRRAQKAATKAVDFNLGKAVDTQSVGAEVALSDQGFGFTVLKKGDGLRGPSQGDSVTVHYTGKLKDGTVFDSSRERGQPFTFTIGVTPRQVIKGWDEGIMDMSLGERAMLHVPSYKAYGESGSGAIPPHADLDFDVEVLAINDRREPGFYPPATEKSGSERAAALCFGTAAVLAAQVLV